MPRRFRAAFNPVPTGAARAKLLRITDVAAGANDFAATDAGFVAKLAGRGSSERLDAFGDRIGDMLFRDDADDFRRPPAARGRLSFIPR
jgi:hypothetical protein